MAAEVNEQHLDTSCSDRAEEKDQDRSIVAEHRGLDRDEPEAAGECSGGATEHLEMPQQPTDPHQGPRLQGKQEEEPKPESSLGPPAAEVAGPAPGPPMAEGKGAKRMMEDDADADAFKEMPDVCQEARQPGRAVLLPDLFGEAHQAHSSLEVGRAGGCAKVEQAVPCFSNMSSENQRKRFRGFAYKETEGPQVAYERLQELLFQWLKPEARSKEEIVEQLVLEQFLNLLPEDVQRWVRERHPENGDEAVALAEDYQFLHPEPGRRPYPERARQRPSARSWLR